MSQLLRAARVAQRAVVCRAARTAYIAPAVRHMSGGGFSPPIPTPSEITGRQAEEAYDLAAVAGFNDQPALGPFGTIKSPVRIYSSFHSRYVGCKGGDHNKHRLFWFELKAGPKHVCTECGQVFQLVTPHGGEAAPHQH